MIKEVGAKVVLVDVDPKTRNIDLSMVEKGLYSNTKAIILVELFFFFSSRRRHTRLPRDWSSDVCSSDLRADFSRGARAGTMSEWREEKNRRALARLNRALPEKFPAPVLIDALARPLIPAMPRRAVDLYWRAHPLRADKLARGLAARSGAPAGWTWQLGVGRQDGRSPTFRFPPTPYRERAFSRGPGFCCLCGQPVYRFG